MENLLTPDQQKTEEAITFIRSFESVILGSVTNSGHPHTSYAPYITDNGKFYIYVSGLALHARSLENGVASLLFIENEQRAKTIYARKRLTINCRVSTIERGNQHYSGLLDHLETRHGPTIKLLRTLPDFLLFELSPDRALFVTGFGAAYDLTTSMAQLV
jgi:putative heme iron utilization protein